MIFEGALHPYGKDENGRVASNEMHLHPLPWPIDALSSLGAQMVRVRVTLSYFVEPSPGRRGWTKRHRYASHGLRFRMSRPAETATAFINRLSTSALDEESSSAGDSDSIAWTVGVKGRTRGSIHSDWFVAPGVDVADCGLIAVHPVSGWWQERAHLERYETPARYGLVVSLETDDLKVDLHEKIAALAPLPVAIDT